MQDEKMTPAAIAALVQGEYENAKIAMTPGGIQEQEREGQRDLNDSQKFPIECNSSPGLERCDCNIGHEMWLDGELYEGWIHELPEEKQGEVERLPCRTCGGTCLAPSSIEALEEAGFEFGDRIDDLFWEVSLPNGWRKEPTDHSMWTIVYGPDDGERARVFYKAAFYDRAAHFFLECRYRCQLTFQSAETVCGAPDYDIDYDDQRNKQVLYDRLNEEIVRDSGEWIRRDAWRGRDDQRYELEQWADEHMPGWDHCLKSWNIEP